MGDRVNHVTGRGTPLPDRSRPPRQMIGYGSLDPQLRRDVQYARLMARKARTQSLIAPDPPSDLAATPISGGVVSLSWTAPQDKDVREYQVWRKDGNFPTDPTGAVYIADETGTRHTDTTGTPGKEYTWYVKALDNDENASGFSIGAVATVPQTGPGDIDQTPPVSLAGIGLTVSGHTLYQDAQGNWFVKATLSLTGIPTDNKRAYIQIKHRRSGSTTYALDDQLYVASGSATAYVDDLLPNVAYEYAAVPVSHFGIEGTGKTTSATTPKDASPPATPTISASQILRGIAVDHSSPTPEPDWARDEVQVLAEADVADGWLTVQNPTVTASYRTIHTDPNSGVQAQRVQITASTGAGNSIMKQSFPAAAGQVWTISAWMRGSATGTGQAYIALTFRDASGSSLQSTTDAYVTPPASWTQRSHSATAPANTATVDCELAVRAQAAGDTADVYWDDASATHDGGPEQFTNPGFETVLGLTGWVTKDNGKNLRSEITDGMVAGGTYYARVRRWDTSGNVSAWSAEASAVAGKATDGDYGDGTVGTIHIAQDAVTELEILEVSDATGTSTTSATFVDVPGFSVSFTLQGAATVLIYCTMDAYAYSTASGVYVVGVGTQLVIDGSAASGSIRRALYNEVDSGGAPQQYMYLRGALPVVTSRQLQAGAHTIKAQFRREGSDAETAAVVYDRILGVQILKR